MNMTENKIINNNSEIEYAYVALLSNKINVLIVGGQRSAYIKCKTFSKSGCNIVVVAKEYGEEFEEFKDKKNVILEKGSYIKAHLENKHLVVIALSLSEVEEEIKKDCEELSKLYLTCSNFNNGNFITPYQRKSKHISFGLNIENGSPMTSRFIGSRILSNLGKYDSYVNYVRKLRETLKETEIKDKVLNFISSEDFYFFYELGKEEIVLKMFYGSNEGIY